MEGYAHLDKTIAQRSEVFKEQLYSIDNDFYNSWYSVRYHRLFENELRGIEKKQNQNGKEVYISSILIH